MSTRRLIVTADDFGRAVPVNEAVEDAHVNGILTAASLMVNEAAVEDALERARRLPSLAVGLHVTLVDGIPALAPERIPDLVGRDGRFTLDLVKLGVGIFFRPAVRRQVAAEMRAQFERYQATGLPLAHVDFHHHYHLHPTVFQLVVPLAVEFGAPGIRIPYEPPGVSMRAQGDKSRTRLMNGMFHWRRTQAMRALARRSGLAVNDRAFGINDSGAMTAERVGRFLDHLPEGVSELYGHPATRHWEGDRAMPSQYLVDREYQALIDPANLARVREGGIELTSFAGISRP